MSSDDEEVDGTWLNAWDTALPASNLPAAQPALLRDDSTEVLVKDEKGTGSVINSAVVINDNKAGMEGLDKEKINQIIYEASKGSPYYKNEQKKEEQLKQQIEEMEERRKKITPQQLAHALQKADQLIENLESKRDLTHTIVHVDMDAFYAAVEMLDRPELKDKPLAVGGNYMLSTSNYAARRYGVRAAMPGFIARKLCPDLVIVPCNFAKYTAMSERIQKIFADYDPNFSAMSLDEAYMDISNHLRHRIEQGTVTSLPGYADPSIVCRCVKEEAFEVGAKCNSCGKVMEEPTYESFGLTAEEVVREMRFRIFQETCLTSSAGIAPNTMLAKVCSDRNKPNGQFALSPTREAVMEFIEDLPIRKICGIGKVSEKMLRALGIATCSQLYDHRATLFHLYSSITFEYFMRVSRGIGSARVERGQQRKSMSVERTFKEHSKPSELEEICHDLSQLLADDLQSEQLVGKTVTLKLKTVQFEVRTRAHTLSSHTNNVNAIFAAARDVLRGEIASVAPEPLRLRLMGVRMSSLIAASEENRQNQCTIKSMVERLRRQQGDQANDVLTIPDTWWSPTKKHKPNQHPDLSPDLEDSVSSEASDVAQTFAAIPTPSCSKTDLPDNCDSNEARLDMNNCSLTLDSAGETVAPSKNRSDVTRLECPVCGSVKLWDLNEFNQHIDVCLNRQMVRDILSTEKKTSAPKSSARSNTPASPSKKRRKLQPSNDVTLHRFFQCHSAKDSAENGS